MQGAAVTSATVWRVSSVPSAFQLVKGISNYSNSHMTFSLNCNRLSQYSIYKKAFHTTTHQINTSQRMEKSAAPEQRVNFTLSHWNLWDRNIGFEKLFFFLEIHLQAWEITDIFGYCRLVCACTFPTAFIMSLDSLWPFQVVPQSPQHLPGSSGLQCSSPGRRCVCSSHRVKQQFRNITDTRTYKVDA